MVRSKLTNQKMISRETQMTSYAMLRLYVVYDEKQATERNTEPISGSLTKKN